MSSGWWSALYSRNPSYLLSTISDPYARKTGSSALAFVLATSERQRFTIAHELGHALLHEGDELHVDHGFSVNFRSPRSSEGTSVEEVEANTFAATLLIPFTMLRRELQGGRIDIENDVQVARLARRYIVSSTAMNFRLMNLLPREYRSEA